MTVSKDLRGLMVVVGDCVRLHVPFIFPGSHSFE